MNKKITAFLLAIGFASFANATEVDILTKAVAKVIKNQQNIKSEIKQLRNRLSANVSRLNKKISANAGDIINLQDDFAEATRVTNLNFEKTRKKVKEVDSKADNILSKLEAHIEEYKKLNTKIVSNKSDIEKKASEIVRLDKEINRLRKTIEQLKEDSKKSVFLFNNRYLMKLSCSADLNQSIKASKDIEDFIK